MSIKIGTGGTLGPPANAVASRSKKIEDAGFDLITWPDHLMGWLPESLWSPDISKLAAMSPSKSPHVFLDPVACIAAASTSTERVQLGTCVTDPIRRHPAVLANEFLTLHHMSQGRAILGIGAGEGENTIPYGLDFSYQVSKMKEAIEVVRLLWGAEESVDYEGRFFNLKGAVLGLGPYEDTFPPIWVGAHGQKMCAITGELGDGWIPVMMPIDTYNERLSWINDARSKAGRLHEPFDVAVRAYCVPHEDHEKAHELMNHPLIKGLVLSLPDWMYKLYGASHPMGDGFHGLSEYIPSGITREHALDMIDRIPFELVHDYIAHGSPDDMIEKMTPYVESGATSVVLHNMAFLADPGHARKAFNLIAETAQEAHRHFDDRVIDLEEAVVA
jgi:phthiodiolone/phenolphthiodiolone dimycocerosates ketoreductase